MDENIFIKNNFNIRTCFKFCTTKSDICHCNRNQSEHGSKECNDKWSYDSNTRLDECNYYGTIKFSGCDDLCTDHKFIRFNVIGDSADEKNSLKSIAESVYTLTNHYWRIPTPKLIISVIGGFKRMNISTQQKKNFKQGLIDIMKKDKTVVITGGFNTGVHKLVSETIREFRIHHENANNHAHLIGISTWGVVWNNNSLGPRKGRVAEEQPYTYRNNLPNKRGKVALDPNCDCFLFCDDGTELSYDKEVDFRMLFEKLSETNAKAFAVQILFEGGSRAVLRASETLKNNISIVVLKGSGRAADLISEVVELKKINLEKNIATIVDEYKDPLRISDNSLPKFKECLLEMYMKYHKQIIIYDMLNSNIKFGKMIVEAIISGQTGRSLSDTLSLTIRFDCADIAKKEVFLHSDYSKIDADKVKGLFFDVLKDNKYEFVILFLENDIDIEDIVTMSMLIELYKVTCNSVCAELINDFATNPIHSINVLISILSGNILEDFYSDVDPSKSCGAQDLFLWALISGRIELAEIFWRVGKDHVSSGLIGSTILKNMAFYILKRGDSELHNKLSIASDKFEELSFNVLTKAYNENKKKTHIVLIRELKAWNSTTCFRIALSGNLLEFLSHSACRSYTTEVWMGGLSPFLSLWKILLSIPFSLFSIYHLIMPSFHKNKSNKKHRIQSIENPSFLTSSPEECIIDRKQSIYKEPPITYWKAMKIFYTAPIVKFYINFASYIIFLLVFAYLNLVELKPRDKIKSIRDVGAEIFVNLYILSFIIEETRQIKDQERTDFCHKVQSYFSGSCNQLDAFIIVIFIFSTVVRFILLENHFMICRCLFSISYCMFCLRTMQFYFAYEFVGPKVIMIRNMIRDIVFFLSIFALFIVSFGTLSQSMRSPNSEMNIFLLKDIIQMPYFQTYGELMLDKLFDDSLCNTTNCYFQQSTVTIGFAVYLLLTNILLVNLLIAMFGYTFNQIQDQSGKYWLFIRLQLVEEFYMKPILSPPLNLFFYLYSIIASIYKYCCCRKAKSIHGQREVYDNLLLKNLPGDENIKITGFEQICMESSLEETQSHLSDFLARTNTENQEKPEFIEKSPCTTDVIIPLENQDIPSMKSFQVRCDKRFERLEKNMERLISKEDV